MADTAAARATLIERATRAGLGDEALARYTERVEQLSDAELGRLDPATFRGPAAAQPDQTTCGSSSLVMSRMVNDPAYAMYVATGHDPVTGVSDPGQVRSGSPGSRWRCTNAPTPVPTAMATGSCRGPDGWARSPGRWRTRCRPRAAPACRAPPTASTPYGWRTAGPASTDGRCARAGHTVPVYVGSRLRPAHVVLVTATDGESLTFYQPGGGRTVHVTRDQWRRDQFTGALGWSRPWAIVVPRAGRPQCLTTTDRSDAGRCPSRPPAASPRPGPSRSSASSWWA